MLQTTATMLCYVKAFLDFQGFDFRSYQFNTVYNSILLSSPLVLLEGESQNLRLGYVS